MTRRPPVSRQAPTPLANKPAPQQRVARPRPPPPSQDMSAPAPPELVEVRGTVKRITFSNGDNGFTVIKVRGSTHPCSPSPWKLHLR